MKIIKLETQGFRNLADTRFLPGDEVNVIWGENAQGKTNLLESIWIFSGAKSFRGSKESDYIGFDKEITRLDLTFHAGGREQTAQLVFAQDGRKVLLNGIKQERLSSLSGSLRAVVFSPDHLELVKQGPKERRRLLDVSLCQAYPKYGKILESYEKILKQRAVLLKDAAAHSQVFDLLEVWDESLIEYGGYISWMRAKYIARLAGYASEAYMGITGGREMFSARYDASCGKIEPAWGRKEVGEILRAAVRRNRLEDIRQGRTGIGPHRDDIEILIGDKSARAFGSQGQQRSCVLALKLAECRLLEEGAGEPPIVLLDDVMSELDAGRRRYLLTQLTGKQVIITCCDPDTLAVTGNSRVFYMKRGELAMDN
ncbi:MAG: DNA replication/repair protein RecF [Oscillospiraceae bacterium]|nr:DNA replication/repair protein RecF [Oscillospiraceae bacterium]